MTLHRKSYMKLVQSEKLYLIPGKIYEIWKKCILTRVMKFKYILMSTETLKKSKVTFSKDCDEAVLMKNLKTHSFALTHEKEGNKIEHNTENRNKILAIFCNPCKLCFSKPKRMKLKSFNK